VAGIRPTLGRLASFNGTAAVERPITGQLMAVQGVLARRVADVRLGYHAMSPGDPRDPWWMPVPLELAPVAKPLSVALCPEPARMVVHPQVSEAVRRAGAILAESGYQVELAEPPGIERMFEVWAQTVTTDLRTTMWPLIAQHADLQARTAIGLWFELFPPIDLDSYIRLLAERSKHLRDWQLFMKRYPIVVGPNSGQPPFEVGFDCRDLAASRQLLNAQCLMTVVNGLGLPSVAVPVGQYDGGPLGVQVIANRFREAVALTAAEAIETGAPVATPLDPR
jgi:amidase